MFEIRNCVAADFDSVVELLKQLWPGKELDLAALRSVFDCVLASDVQQYFCAVEEGQIIGFGSLSMRSNLWAEGFLGHIDELIVSASHRGQGVGRQILERLTSSAKERGCRRIELDSSFHRTEAHEFYERQGFEKRGFVFSKKLD